MTLEGQAGTEDTPVKNEESEEEDLVKDEEEAAEMREKSTHG